MAKFNLSKKTLVKKKSLLAILHHNPNNDLNILLEKLDLKNIEFLLIVVDGKFKFKIKNKINKKIIFQKKSKYAIPINRNLALDFAIKKKYKILFFIDSDIEPNIKLIFNHLKIHEKFSNVAAVGGSVVSSSNFSKKFNLWEYLDGKLSWFQAVKNEDYIFVKKPYHLPTCNLSIKLNMIKKNKIKFNQKLFTGEDAFFFEEFRRKNLKFLLSSKCNVIHHDRKNFLSFFSHHMKWGRHQYYTLYQSKFPKKFFYLVNIFFILFYPLILIPITFLQSLFVISPWIKLNFANIFLFPAFLSVHFSKSVFTYIEALKFKYIFK